MIKDFVLGEKITAFLLLKQMELKAWDSGTRLSLVLGDRTGEIEGVVWNEADKIKADLDGAQVVKVRGLMTSYRGKPQITVEIIRKAEPGEYNPDDLKRDAGKSPEKLKEQFQEILTGFQDKYLAALLKAFQADEELFEQWLKAPAGKKFHHDYISGLAAHSLSMAHTADLLCGNYPELDRELLITGAILHDIGKIIEFEGELVYDYSDAGRLVGHITLGDHIVADLIKGIEDFPETLALKVRHLILAHHGDPQKGASVRPKTREAFVLHFLDEIDSKLDAINKIAEKADDKWSEYIKPLEDFLFFE